MKLRDVLECGYYDEETGKDYIVEVNEEKLKEYFNWLGSDEQPEYVTEHLVQMVLNGTNISELDKKGSLSFLKDYRRMILIDFNKEFFDGKGIDFKEKFAKELGDIAWYLAEAAYAIDMPLEDILEGNIEKLRKRFPEGFDSEKSINRKEWKDD